MNIVKVLTALLIFNSSFSFAQEMQNRYSREIKDVTDPWHKIIFPDDLFGKVAPEMTDIRILGITSTQDTITVPYFLKATNWENEVQKVKFEIINTSKNENGFYFTFDIPSTEPINHIKLNFKQQNFDWRVKLEGSLNQNEWFTILDNYRLVSIKNDQTDFDFTDLIFPTSKYRFFRLVIDSKEQPSLISTTIEKHATKEGVFKNHSLKKFVTRENKKTRATEIDIELNHPVPISKLKIDVKDSLDYYRPVIIKYLHDSDKTEKGWSYNYHTLTSRTIQSNKKNELEFTSTIAQKLQILILNQDNAPLSIQPLTVSGPTYELVARFAEKANYFLTYGNTNAPSPQYDLARFKENVPTTIKALQLGSESKLAIDNNQTQDPMFKNKMWLWAIMVVLVLVLGGFTIKMMKKE